MKQDSNHILNSNKDRKVSFEELHIRHLNLLMDFRSEKLNNWFLKIQLLTKKAFSAPQYSSLFFILQLCIIAIIKIHLIWTSIVRKNYI